MGSVDAEGLALQGAAAYRLEFDAPPPADPLAFWSIQVGWLPLVQSMCRAASPGQKLSRLQACARRPRGVFSCTGLLAFRLTASAGMLAAGGLLQLWTCPALCRSSF